MRAQMASLILRFSARRADLPVMPSASCARSSCDRRGVRTIRSLRTIAAGHAFVQNLRRGHYEITVDVDVLDRVRAAFDNLSLCL